MRDAEVGEMPSELWSERRTVIGLNFLNSEGKMILDLAEEVDSGLGENPNRGVAWPCNRAHGAVGQNRSRSIKWAEKQEKFQPKETCFFLHSPFIELTRSWCAALFIITSLPIQDSFRGRHQISFHAGLVHETFDTGILECIPVNKLTSCGLSLKLGGRGG
jgi:hypothetical protein